MDKEIRNRFTFSRRKMKTNGKARIKSFTFNLNNKDFPKYNNLFTQLDYFIKLKKGFICKNERKTLENLFKWKRANVFSFDNMTIQKMKQICCIIR